MALGDLMASRYPQSLVTITNHLDDCASNHEDGDFNKQKRDSDPLNNTSTTTSMAYLPHNTVLCQLRHDAFEVSVPWGLSANGFVSKWRPKDRMKTGCVALVLCLNISVDPPDVIKISPCARMECWIDPFSMPPPKALEAIGKNLSSQYERWQPRARYKVQLDPTVEEVKKLCTSCRKYAKTERVLFHYNGHGVPKPTSNGEIWLFNKSYTQYIPLPISDLDSWIKTPSIYVFDCSSAGMIVNAFIELLDTSATGAPRDCILLAACEAHETLPQSIEFPADVFTSCLTTPIKMALRWFCRRCFFLLSFFFLHRHWSNFTLGCNDPAGSFHAIFLSCLLMFCKRSLLCDFLTHSLIDQIPGRQNDRKTLLGELNWIFTAVTDTIAWNVLPRDLFQRLFRQDLLVASLFRNFLLADRIMRSANCSPISHPMLPPTHQHHMWDAWDMAAEICLSQLPSLVEDLTAEFQSSPFFTEQLTAFEVWLDHGSEHKKPPEQLPIVLQVLLSQCHRFRALVLLGRFLDMGCWAVDLALSVGIFPYVLKLLQTTTPELRQILVFIWTKILALDKSCQVDLVKDGGHTYFIRFLDSIDAYPEQRAMAAFVLAVVVDGHRHGQEACIEAGLIHVCLKHLASPIPSETQSKPLFLQWLCLCLGKLWEDYAEAQILSLQADSHAMCSSLLSEPQPEVRASAVFALGTLLELGFDPSRVSDEDFDDDEKIRAEAAIVKSLLNVVSDGSPQVRTEVVVALSRFVSSHNRHLKAAADAYLLPQTNSLLSSLPTLAHVKCVSGGCIYPTSYSHVSTVPSPMRSMLKAGSVIPPGIREGKATISSSPITNYGLTHGSPLSDDSSQRSDSGSLNYGPSNGAGSHARHKMLDNAVYLQCVLAMCTLAYDPSPQIAGLGRRVLSMIGIDQTIAKPLKIKTFEPAAAPNPSLAGLVRSNSWFDMSGGHLPLSFRTPPVSPPRSSYFTGMRRVCSLEFRPNLLDPPDSGLGDPFLGSDGTPKVFDRSFLSQSVIYNWSCGHFSRPLLSTTDERGHMTSKREEKEKIVLDHIVKCQRSSVSQLSEPIARWDTKFQTGAKTAVLQPFSPVVVAADESEQIRVWNYEEASLLNCFDNHDYHDKGISKLCLVNELDDSLLLVASCDGSVRVWKDYTIRGKQRFVTGFLSIQGHRTGIRSLNTVVDWQQQSGFLYASGELPSVMVWDLEKEQLLNSIPWSSECGISAISASQVHGGQFVAGFFDGTVRVYDIRAPEQLTSVSQPHTQKVGKVVGIGFQPGLDPLKIVSASQAGDIQFLDIRNQKEAYLTIDAHRGSLTALAVHRHAPLIASGSAKQLIKVFSLEGEQLGTIRYYPTFMGQKIGSVSCLAFHPYQVLLAAGSADACVSIYVDDGPRSR